MRSTKARCPLCNGVSVFLHSHPHVSQELYHCNNCKYWFVYPHESYIHSINDVHVEESEFWSSDKAHAAYKSWRNSENDRVANQILSQIDTPAETKLLEIGFGEGPLTATFMNIVGEYWGIEPIPISFEQTADRLQLNRNRIFNIKAEDMLSSSPFEAMTDYFDVIVMISVLEHLPNPMNILESCRKLLAPGGTLFISVPDSTKFAWLYTFRKTAGLEPWTYFHISFFSEASLDYIFRNKGFEVLVKKRNSLLSSDSIEYFRWLYNSKLLEITMRLFKKLHFDRLIGMETIFYNLVKR